MNNLALRESQLIALEALQKSGINFAALWAEPRSGKTAVVLHWLKDLSPGVVLIVGPKIAETVWRTEIAKWLKVEYRFHSLMHGNIYPTLDMFHGLTFLFVNYEQFGARPFKRLKPFLKSVSKHFNGMGAMILDESHMIKRPSSIWGRNIRPLAHNWHYRMLVTGTPVTNPAQIDAIYGQWTFLDPEIRDKWPSARDFREHFGEWSMFKGFPELIRPRNQWELNAYIQPHVITMTGIAEPLIPIKFNYDVPLKAQKYEQKLLKQGIVKISCHTVTGLNPLTRLLRMRMLVAGWCKDDEGKDFKILAALQARLQALDQIMAKTSGKSIISCAHLREISLVSKHLKAKGITHLIINGATKEKERLIQDFQWRPDKKVLIVQPQTVSMAVDLSVADTLIWYSSDFNYVTFKQASDRIKLSLANPQVFFLCGKNSVDEDIWITLQEDHAHLQKTISKIRGQRPDSLTSWDRFELSSIKV